MVMESVAEKLGAQIKQSQVLVVFICVVIITVALAPKTEQLSAAKAQAAGIVALREHSASTVPQPPIDPLAIGEWLINHVQTQVLSLRDGSSELEPNGSSQQEPPPETQPKLSGWIARALAHSSNRTSGIYGVSLLSESESATWTMITESIYDSPLPSNLQPREQSLTDFEAIWDMLHTERTLTISALYSNSFQLTNSNNSSTQDETEQRFKPEPIGVREQGQFNTKDGPYVVVKTSKLSSYLRELLPTAIRNVSDESFDSFVTDLTTQVGEPKHNAYLILTMSRDEQPKTFDDFMKGFAFVPVKLFSVTLNPLSDWLNTLNKGEWSVGSFKNTFAALKTAAKGRESATLLTLVGTIDNMIMVNEGNMEIFGVEVSRQMVRNLGLFALLVAYAYLYFHMAALARLKHTHQAQVPLPWVGVYHGKPAYAFSFATLILFPVLVSLVVGFRALGGFNADLEDDRWLMPMVILQTALMIVVAIFVFIAMNGIRVKYCGKTTTNAQVQDSEKETP